MLKMKLEDKINLLTNELAVTEEELIESLELKRSFVIDEDLYLSFQSVMIDAMRITPKESLTFLHHFLNRFDIGNGFENTVYRLFHECYLQNDENERASFLQKSFGSYMFSKGFVLLKRINLIEELKYKIS